MKSIRYFSSSILLLVVSCITYTPHVFQAQYTEEILPEVTQVSGNNTIAGSAFLRQNGGGTVSCAGNTVLLEKKVLMARSPYAREANSLPSNIARVSDIDPRHLAFERQLEILESSQQLKTSCDVDGKFTFVDVAPGLYQVRTKVYWVVGREGQGGIVGEEIRIPEDSANETYNVVVSNVTRSCTYAFDGCPVR